jgi:serine phosphatase RsbU (regulator of sigma subunit)
VYDPSVDQLRFVNAGHLPPLLVTPGAEPCFLTRSPSTPLGLGRDWGFHEDVAEFPPGSTVLMYTDGLVERRDTGIVQQLERMRAAVANFDGGAEEACDSALAAFAPDGSDDVALLAFQAGARIVARRFDGARSGESVLPAPAPGT